MAGSRGYFRSKPSKLVEELRSSQDETVNAQVDAEVSAYIGELLADFNARDVEATRKHLESVHEALEKEIEGTIDLALAGSVAKHTYVDGLSDIDALIYINNCELAANSPRESLQYLAQRLGERFPNTPIRLGALAVTVSFSDQEIQLLPAIRCGVGLKISDWNGKDWSRANPTNFSDALTKVNQKWGGKAVPVIKLAKSILASLPEKQRLSGYHVESIAIEAFKNYSGPKTSKSMLKHLFEIAPRLVLAPIKDRSGQSIHVDDYLGNAHSSARVLAAGALQRIAKRMRNADAAGSSGEWKRLLTPEN